MCQMVTIDVRVDTINKEMRRLIMVIAFITSLGEIMLYFHLEPCRFALFIHTATCMSLTFVSWCVMSPSCVCHHATTGKDDTRGGGACVLIQYVDT